jgi:ATP-dependent Lon protease
MGYKNGIILLDEIDKLSNSSRGNEILGTLMHLCDPTQNSVFEDKYLDGIPIDFSNYIFVYSLNNMEIMNPALLSRIGQNIIKIGDYSLDDKIAITKLHIIPELIKNNEIVFNDDVIKYIIGECIPIMSKGIRELKAQVVKIVRMVKYYNALGKEGYTYPLVLDKSIISYVLNKVDKSAKNTNRYIL